MVLLRGSTLVTSNVGDSRAVLARSERDHLIKEGKGDGKARAAASESSPMNGLRAIDLTKDQNVHCPLERKRILNAGGYVTVPRSRGFPARVWLDESCTKFGLAMSRSFGDHAMKQIGVISDPVVTLHDLTERDEVRYLHLNLVAFQTLFFDTLISYYFYHCSSSVSEKITIYTINPHNKSS